MTLPPFTEIQGEDVIQYFFIDACLMKKQTDYEIGIEIDELTNSIVSTISGESFDTEVTEVKMKDLKVVTKKNKWNFNWKEEFKLTDRTVYKLTTKDEPNVLQGLISITDREDHFYVHLIESAPYNLGKRKLYEGVPGNLFAFTCKCSWDKGYEGVVSFVSKTKLIDHYEKTLEARHFGQQTMVIYSHAALKLIKKYFLNL